MTTKALAPKEEPTTAVSEWDNFTWDDDGTETVRPTFPTVKLVQAVSTMDGATGHIGWWYRSDTETFIPDPLALGVMMMSRRRTLWEKGNDTPLCRSNDGIVPADNQPVWDGPKKIRLDGKQFDLNGREPRSCDACPFGKWDDETGDAPKCKASLVLMADLNVDGEKPELAQVRLSTTSIKPFTDFVSRRVVSKNRKLLQFRIELGSEETVGGGNKYQRITVAATDLATEKALEYATLLRALRSDFMKEAEREDVQPETATATTWENGEAPLDEVPA